jgi:hypothetical protein
MHKDVSTTLQILNHFIIQRLPSLGIDALADLTAETSNARGVRDPKRFEFDYRVMSAARERTSSSHRNEHGQPANTFRVSLVKSSVPSGYSDPRWTPRLVRRFRDPRTHQGGGRNCQRYRPHSKPSLNFSTCYQAKELGRFCVSLYRA